MEEKFVCPVSDFTCPYYKKGGYCSLDFPIFECDEAAYYAEEEDDNCDYETGFDPYLGCYTDDC